MRFLLLFVLAMLTTQGAMAQPTLIPDYTHTTQYRVPQGWKVQASNDNGVYTWKATEPPGTVGSPSMVVLAMNNMEGSGNEILRSLLQNEIVDLQDVVPPFEPSQDETHLRWKGVVQGIPARITAMFLRDKANNRIFLAFLAAPEARYESLGGDNLMYQMLNRVNPMKAPVEAESGNIQDEAVQNEILENTGMVLPSQLTGTWMQVFSYSDGQTYQDVNTGELRFGERGYGHLLELRKDGSYQLTYQYKNFFQGCENTVDIVETGTYQVNSNFLMLTRGQYTGNFNVCGELTPQEEKNPAPRTFKLGLSAAGNQLVIRGEPFEYSIGTETDVTGKTYIQEGFEKQ